MDPNWAWAALWVGWGITEAWALAMRRDRLQPNTYWIRRIPWVVRAGTIAWLAQHFLFCGDAC